MEKEDNWALFFGGTIWKIWVHERNYKVTVGIGWTAPRWPFFRLNTDGATGLNGVASSGLNGRTLGALPRPPTCMD